LMDRPREAIHVVDPNGIVLEANQAAERLTGRTKPEIVGRSFLETVAPEKREEVRKRFETSLQRGGAQGEATRIVRPDGTTVDIEVSASVIEIAGAPLVLAILRDISEQNAMAEQLRLAQKMEAVGQLAGGVAHDFNNLLTAILGYSQILAPELRGNPEHFSAIEEIRKAGERAAGLTRQLLAFSRKQMLELRVLDLNEIVHHIQEMLSRLIGEDIQVVMNLDPALGTVRADAGQIEQVIMNLAVNARDAMPRGGQISLETANVELGETYAQTHVPVQPGPYVMLAVSDTGVGMDEATRERIFEPFFTTKEKGHGTGLGLSTVYGIVKQSGGYIWVYTEPGRGTAFKVYLPRVQVPAEALVVPEPAALPAVGNETILLVEDEESVRALVRKTLEARGYHVLEAADGGEAVEIARSQSVDLLLTDMVLPGMGGSEVAARIHDLHPQAKILYTSGYTDDVIVRRGLMERGAAFLEKPFTPTVLARKVREVLDS
jgi:two-component system cell cycle sensor histidine kinase/response regulator CckA